MKKVFSFLLCLIFCITFSINIFAYTVDDVRDLLGKNRVDMTFTQEEISTIIAQYNAIERQNAILRLFELGKEINLNNSNEEEYNSLLSEIEERQQYFSIVFQSGESILTVFKAKSELESSLHKLSTFRKNGFDITVEFIDNDWAEKYFEVQEMLRNLGEQFDIGDVGYALRCPIEITFQLTGLYGNKLNEKTQDSIVFHNGIDLYAGEGNNVLALWNGVISNIYQTDKDGMVVEISHGEDLKTIYKHLKNVIVEVGESVKQYDIIGTIMRFDFGEKSHLHLSVFLDGEYVNPIYLFGNKGLYALREYVSNTSGNYGALMEVESNFKNIPDNHMSESKENGGVSINKPSGGFNKSNFLNEIHKNEIEDLEGEMSP